MDSNVKNKKDTIDPTICSPKAVKQVNKQKRNVHFIVTRNTRNAWMDDLYESTSGQSDYPTFH